ncbi:MAG: methyltransferase [Bacteroidales bacterium]|nr:methyltransferase [Bacteroidales bacterium]
MEQAYHAKTLKGLENVLAEELMELGALDVHPVNRGVNFNGSTAILYKSNIYLRTALRILMKIKSFKAGTEQQLYNQVKSIDWSEYMTFKHSFAIDAVSFSEKFRNSHFIELKVKDAIADQFREKTSIRPSVDKKNPDVRINVHVNDDFFTISLDSSGESLHKRGYRKYQHAASMSEVLAAGMVLLTGYRGERPFVDPMCGSGTIAIEAALIASGKIPGAFKRRYGFQNWTGFDPLLFERIREQIPAEEIPGFPIVAADIDKEAVRITSANVRDAGLDDIVTVRQMDIMEANSTDSPSLVVMNPPYGERLDAGNLQTMYSGIGNILKHKFAGSEAWIFTSNMEALKYVGLKPEKKIQLFNGKLDCRFVKYRLFSGTRKHYVKSNSS